jgi:alpha-galactosidase
LIVHPEQTTKRRKIVLIGAGSASFTQGLVADLIFAPDLGPWQLGLVDVGPQALETARLPPTGATSCPVRMWW